MPPDEEKELAAPSSAEVRLGSRLGRSERGPPRPGGQGRAKAWSGRLRVCRPHCALSHTSHRFVASRLGFHYTNKEEQASAGGARAGDAMTAFEQEYMVSIRLVTEFD